MSIVHDRSVGGSLGDFSPTRAVQQKLHRIATVRNQQDVSLRSASRRMGRKMSTVRSQEEETQDLRISDLIRWQKVLGVPLQDLLVDPEAPLSKSVMERAQLVRLMKSAAAIKEVVESEGANRLATMLIQQLIDIMPELEHVSAWHSVGQRRSLEEYGRIVERSINDDMFT